MNWNELKKTEYKNASSAKRRNCYELVDASAWNVPESHPSTFDVAPIVARRKTLLYIKKIFYYTVFYPLNVTKWNPSSDQLGILQLGGCLSQHKDRKKHIKCEKYCFNVFLWFLCFLRFCCQQISQEKSLFFAQENGKSPEQKQRSKVFENPRELWAAFESFLTFLGL